MRINSHLLLSSSLLMFLSGCAGTPSPTTPENARPQLAQPAQKPAQTPVVESIAKPATRPSVVTLRFNSDSIDSIIAGTKTSTCRKGVREFPGNVAIGTDGKRNVNLVILSATTKKFSDLSASDAKSDGSESVDALKAAVQKSYPDIADDDALTVVSFHVAQ